MARDHIDIKELRRDAFREKVFLIAGWVYHRRYWAAAATASIVVAVGLIFAYFGYQNYQAEAQAESFYAVERILNDTAIEQKKKDARAKPALEKFLRESPEAGLSPFAWMYLAQIAWREGDLPGAKEAYQQAKTHSRSHIFTRQLAVIGEAKLREAEGDLAGSAEIFKALPDEPFGDLKAYNLGRLAALTNRTEEARQQFEKVVNQQPRSRLAGWADDALAALPGTGK